MKKNNLLSELLTKQLSDLPTNKKLQYNDIKRLTKYLAATIFDENICSLWSGYVTNVNNIDKGIYINFYFKGKKAILHRLLYTNFVGILDDDEYLKFTCPNKGKCCNIHHLKKFKYIKKQEIKVVEEKKNVHAMPKQKPQLTLSFD